MKLFTFAECCASFCNRPSPEITWKKDGQTIGSNQNSFIISRSFFGRLLFIQNIDKEEHEGTYTCEAVNDLNTQSPLSFSTNLKVEGNKSRYLHLAFNSHENTCHVTPKNYLNDK